MSKVVTEYIKLTDVLLHTYTAIVNNYFTSLLCLNYSIRTFICGKQKKKYENSTYMLIII